MNPMITYLLSIQIQFEKHTHIHSEAILNIIKGLFLCIELRNTKKW
jgi:hypothetical protein